MPRRKSTRKAKVIDLPGEQWAYVPDTDGYYVSNLGRYKRITERGDSLRKVTVDPEGYCRVTAGTKKFRLHRLVAEAFVPNPNNYPVVDHLDANKQNNKWDNLEWTTAAENSRRAVEKGLYYRGESTPVIAIDQTDKMCYLFKNIAECATNLNLPVRSANKVACDKQKTVHGIDIIKISGFEDRRNRYDEE